MVPRPGRHVYLLRGEWLHGWRWRHCWSSGCRHVSLSDGNCMAGGVCRRGALYSTAVGAAWAPPGRHAAIIRQYCRRCAGITMAPPRRRRRRRQPVSGRLLPDEMRMCAESSQLSFGGRSGGGCAVDWPRGSGGVRGGGVGRPVGPPPLRLSARRSLPGGLTDCTEARKTVALAEPVGCRASALNLIQHTAGGVTQNWRRACGGECTGIRPPPYTVALTFANNVWQSMAGRRAARGSTGRGLFTVRGAGGGAPSTTALPTPPAARLHHRRPSTGTSRAAPPVSGPIWNWFRGRTERESWVGPDTASLVDGLNRANVGCGVRWS